MKHLITLLFLLLLAGCSASSRLSDSERERTYNGTAKEVYAAVLAYLQSEQFGMTIETEPGAATDAGSIVTNIKETEELRTKVTATIKPRGDESAMVTLYISAEKKDANDAWDRVETSDLRQIYTMYLDGINERLRG